MLGIGAHGPTDSGGAHVAGWNEGERADLRSRIAARQPFLDFVVSRVNAEGLQQQFLVSGEPMFSQSCRFIGYRGIGVELAIHEIERRISMVNDVVAP